MATQVIFTAVSFRFDDDACRTLPGFQAYQAHSQELTCYDQCGAVEKWAFHICVAAPGVHWIDVNLTQQRVYAYEGDSLMNSFVVSTIAR